MSIQFTPDGETLVSGGGDGAVYRWQIQEGGGARMTARLTAYKQHIFAVYPNGKRNGRAGAGSAIAPCAVEGWRADWVIAFVTITQSPNVACISATHPQERSTSWRVRNGLPK